MMLAVALLLAAEAPIRSTPALGMAEGRCRAAEPGPAIIVTAEGLKDRRGALKLELYPPDQADFLADDNKLVAAGKTFRRVIEPVPAAGPAELCIRVPAPGAYTMALTHDRDGRPKFSLVHDGIGFPGNPTLGMSAPRAEQARIIAGPGITRTTIILNYRTGILSFGPIAR